MSLKPCPFCGTKPKRQYNGFWHLVFCTLKSCGVVVSSRSQSGATRAWNRRSDGWEKI